ncbi:MAG: hypothetical protein ACPL4N_01165 [Candidatus Norongarragalinales archaeon]
MEARKLLKNNELLLVGGALLVVGILLGFGVAFFAYGEDLAVANEVYKAAQDQGFTTKGITIPKIAIAKQVIGRTNFYVPSPTSTPTSYVLQFQVQPNPGLPQPTSFTPFSDVVLNVTGETKFFDDEGKTLCFENAAAYFFDNNVDKIGCMNAFGNYSIDQIKVAPIFGKSSIFVTMAVPRVTDERLKNFAEQNDLSTKLIRLGFDLEKANGSFEIHTSSGVKRAPSVFVDTAKKVIVYYDCDVWTNGGCTAGSRGWALSKEPMFYLVLTPK